MKSDDPFNRRNILVVAAEMIKENGSATFRFDELSKRTNVDVVSINRYFDSRSQLIAEAQMLNYFAMVEPLHLVLLRVELAVTDEDENAFWTAVEENMALAWGSGQSGEKWGIVKTLLDIWSDPFAQRHFCDLLDIQFTRWIELTEGAKRLGWIDPEMDAAALTAVFWSASVGQIITSGSSFLDLTPEAARDFYVKIARRRSRQESSPGSQASNSL
ncbi:MAG TPA: TetR family transcriptional regulator [Acidimicrobiales bacterium]